MVSGSELRSSEGTVLGDSLGAMPSFFVSAGGAGQLVDGAKLVL